MCSTVTYKRLSLSSLSFHCISSYFCHHFNLRFSPAQVAGAMLTCIWHIYYMQTLMRLKCCYRMGDSIRNAPSDDDIIEPVT